MYMYMYNQLQNGQIRGKYSANTEQNLLIISMQPKVLKLSPYYEP